MGSFKFKIFRIKLKVRRKVLKTKIFVKRLFINPAFISFLVFIFFAIIIILFTIVRYGYDEDFFKSVLIEAHGMLFDIFIIGVVVLWLHIFIERKREIKRYQEEIDDFRNWESDEAKFRIVGNIKRLNRMGITRINLNDCVLYNAQLENAELEGANLEGTILEEANLGGAIIRGANLRHAEFDGANLLGVDFTYSDLFRVFFRGADLTYAQFDGANMEGVQLQSAIIEYGQLLKAKTLYNAELDSNIKEEIEKNYPHLLKKPKESE
jgi:hypothetical protein